MSAYILLEDGERFEGEAVGAGGHVTGEVVFTTGMSGYQESMTDPSFARQLITFTTAHVGNYGVSPEAWESDRMHAAGAIMREAVNTVDAPGAEQRLARLAGGARHPRRSPASTPGRWCGTSARRGRCAAGSSRPRCRRPRRCDLVLAEPSMIGRDLAREVTVTEPRVEGEGGALRIVALDTGIKRSIVRNFVARGVQLELFPCTTPADELLARDPDGFFLVPGPGDPAALDYVVDTIRSLLVRKPVFGICLGHQLLSRAAGLETFKLPFGHRGANHPVKDLATGRIAITSQNHGFAVAGDPSPPTRRIESELGAAELTHVNLYDGTVEGFRLLDVPAACVQYHPEAGPGPNDSLGLFDLFVDEFDRAA